MGFVRAAKMEDVPPGTIREVHVEGKAIALANVDGQFHAIDNTVIHVGGPLADGTSAPATTLLDLQRRPAPLPLGYACRKRQGNVARCGRKTRRDSRIETSAQGRPRALLSLRAGAFTLFDCGSYA